MNHSQHDRPSDTVTGASPHERPLFRPIEAARGFEEVVQQISGAILSDGMRPGDRLPTTREMAESFGVSRATINEALRVLEHSGLLETRLGSRGGSFVRRPAGNELTRQLNLMVRLGSLGLHDLTEYRLAMEGQNARWAAERATPAELTGLDELVDRFEELRTAEADPRSFEELDVKFHVCVAEATHNELAAAIIRGTVPAIRDLIRQLPPGLDSTLGQVRGVVDAIKRHDGEAAAKELQAHITFFAQALAAHGQTAPDVTPASSRPER
jgi:DNA-binding FadR family transcriptional regulator